MPKIEPGLLQIFRLFAGIQWILMLLVYTSTLPSDDPGLYFQSILGMTLATILLIYLFWWHLSQWLGRYYLPIAIVYSSVGLVVVQAAGIAARMSAGIMGDAALGEEGSLILWLFIPLIVVSTQYGWRAMLVFCLTTTALEVVLALILMNLGGPDWESTVNLALVRLTIFAVVGYIIARLIGGQRSQKRALAEANAQLARHATTLEQLAISRERNRMARELHDTLAHTLSAVALQLEAIYTIWDTNPDMAKETLQRTHEVTRSGLQETRQALQALRSSPLEDLGLLLALKNLAHMTGERTGAQVNVALPKTIGEYPIEVEQNIYRIAEEALNNIAKHAGASTIALKLEADDKHLVLAIADNGVGFDLDQPSAEGHYGLLGMHERAALCGGELHIHSTPQQGTIIRLEKRLSS